MIIDKKQRGPLIICVVVALLAWSMALLPKAGLRKAGNDLLGLSSSAPVPVQPPPPAGVSSKYAEWGGNPFVVDRYAVAAPVEPQEKGLVLNGILWDPAKPFAVINGDVVGIGDEVEQWRVTGITNGTVTLSDGVTTKELEVQ